jgi:hypothetical protein
MEPTVAETTSRPLWRDEYLRDAGALKRFCDRMRAWQRNSENPFERANEAVWSRLTAQQGQLAFNSVTALFARLDAVGEIDRLYREAVEESQIVDPPSIAEFRSQLARVLGQDAALAILPATKA